MRQLTPVRALSSLVALTFFLVFALIPRYNLLDESRPASHFVARQGNGGDTATSSSQGGGLGGIFDPPDQSTSSSAQSSTQQQQTSSSASPTTDTNQATSITPTTIQQQQSSTSQPPSSSPPTSSQAQSSAPPSASSTPSQASSSVFTTNSQGQTSVVVIFDSATPSATSSANSDSSNNKGDDDGGGISTSTIIGLSVAGGVAVIGIIAFFIWKFTRKRFSDLEDNEAIKWPELNTHEDSTSAPLPTHRLGGAGFDTGSNYTPSVAAASTTELYPGGGADPYAIPPLPHLNPNAPYRDDPNPEFYDPYRGPVPQTFDNAAAGEAIPMTQLAGRRSPGPGAALNSYARGPSPAPPQVGYGYGAYSDGRVSPGPQVGGRASPGPQAAYGYGQH